MYPRASVPALPLCPIPRCPAKLAPELQKKASSSSSSGLPSLLLLLLLLLLMLLLLLLLRRLFVIYQNVTCKNLLSPSLGQCQTPQLLTCRLFLYFVSNN